MSIRPSGGMYFCVPSRETSGWASVSSPKSASFNCPPTNRQLAGFTSRWTMPGRVQRRQSGQQLPRVLKTRLGYQRIAFAAAFCNVAGRYSGLSDAGPPVASSAGSIT